MNVYKSHILLQAMKIYRCVFSRVWLCFVLGEAQMVVHRVVLQQRRDQGTRNRGK